MFKVGSTGLFTLNAPWANKSGVLTIDSATSSRALNEYGVDVLNNIFISAGLTEADYNNWLNSADPVMYTVSNGDSVFKVPSTFISDEAENITQKYMQHFLTVNLGYINLNDIGLLNDISEIIKRNAVDVFGVDAEVIVKSFGHEKGMTDTDHDALVATRAQRRTDTLAGQPTYESLASDKQKLMIKIQELEAIIKDKVLTP